MDSSLRPRRWPHDAPDEPLSIAEAHQTMQRHCECLRAECGRKHAAWIALVAAGRIKPDTSRVPA